METKKEFYERGSKYAQMMEGTLDNARSYLYGVTGMIEAQIESGENDREKLQQQILYTFTDFPLAEGSAVFMEPDAYDENDHSYVSSDYGTKTGRISYYYYRYNGKVSYLPTTDTNVVYSEAPPRLNQQKSLVATIPLKLNMSQDKYYVSVVTPNSEIIGVYTSNKEILTLLILMIFLIMIAIILIIRQVVSRATKPLTQLVAISEQISQGDFKFSLPQTANDEVGILAHCFEKMAETITMLMDDIYRLSVNHEQGQMDYTLDAAMYKGDYAKVVESVCQMANSYARMVHDVMNVMEHF